MPVDELHTGHWTEHEVGWSRSYTGSNLREEDRVKVLAHTQALMAALASTRACLHGLVESQAIERADDPVSRGSSRIAEMGSRCFHISIDVAQPAVERLEEGSRYAGPA